MKKLLFTLMLGVGALCFGNDAPARADISLSQGRVEYSGPARGYKKAGKLTLSLPARVGSIVNFYPENAPDASAWNIVTATVKNTSDFRTGLMMAIESYDPESKKTVCSSMSGYAIRPNETVELKVRYFHSSDDAKDWGPKGQMYTFDGFPNKQYHLRSDLPYRIAFYTEVDKVDRGKVFKTITSNFEVSGISFTEAADSSVADDADAFYPCIDRYGQYKHEDWGLKIHQESDFKRMREQEDADLAANPGTQDRDEFGGWASGPSFEAKGHFYTTKYQDKWFLVDPAGKLFWSHGLGSINTMIPTGVDARENYFEELPAQNDPLFKSCYGKYNPRHGWYKQVGKNEITVYNFCLANILRKYGKDGKQYYADFMPRRMRSWGFNTMGNWSFPQNYNNKKFCYAINLDPKQPPVLSGDSGHWVDFFDVFSPDFAKSLERGLTGERGSTIKDPYCIGYFVGNELSWGHEWKLANSVLKSKATQPAKIAFAEFLKDKYTTIEALNAVWKSNFDSFDAFLKTNKPNDSQGARDDMIAFNDVIIEKYFSTVREVIDRVAPGKLFLGCRYNWYTERNLRIAVNYVDVLSFNIYRFSPAQFQLPDGIDMPVIIGEYHFGTLRNGPPGAVHVVAGEAERGEAYRRYNEDALRHPAIIGTHYFQLCDSSTTGRPKDGEDMQIGMVDIADTPYPSMVKAAREIGAKMYQYRLQNDEE